MSLSPLTQTMPAAVSPEAEAERASILRSVEGAPLNAAHFMNPEIAGWWTPAGWFICDHDSARIFARGCTLPTGSTPAWRSTAPRGVCVVCSATAATAAADAEKKKRAAEDAYFARTNVAVAARERRLADY